MNNRVLLATLFALAFQPRLLTAQPNGRSRFVPGQILAQEREGAEPGLASRLISQYGGQRQRYLSATRHHVIRVPETRVDAVIRALSESGQFLSVERDGIARGASIPNDVYYGSQWHLATIQAAAAWNVTAGSASQTIAIIDSGIDPTHPDLAARLVPGWSFLTGTSDTHDVLGHGTAVAGTVGAITNNGIGAAGVTWANPIMPLVVLDSTDYASYSNIAAAIEYAADHGVRIINVSIGGSTSSSTLQSAVNYAWNKGAVVFAAAMNGSGSAPYYPAACTNVVSVSATEPNDTLASFSNYGTWIDLSAPGDTILTTNSGGGYGYWYGTSFSSPIAAGVAALALAIKPALTPSGLVSLLESNSDDLGAPGFDQYFGYGRVNAAKVVAAARSLASAPPSVTITSPGSGSAVSGAVAVNGTVYASASIATVVLYVDGATVASGGSAPFSLAWNTAGATASTHTLTVKATDSTGSSGSASINITVAAVPPPDTTAPAVQITSPKSGTLLSGTEQITVSATDNVGVSQVCIYIDGVLQTTDTSSPYTYSWNTKKASNGAHVITAKAWDRAGNVGVSLPVSVSK